MLFRRSIISYNFNRERQFIIRSIFFQKKVLIKNGTKNSI